MSQMRALQKLVEVMCILVLINFICTSCTVKQKEYTLQSGIIGVEIMTLKKQYADLEVKLRAMQKEEVTFSDEDWDILQEVDSNIDLAIEKYDSIVSLDVTGITGLEVELMWADVHENYNKARDVLSTEENWAKFSNSIKVRLKSLDRQAVTTSGRIEKLINDPETSDMTTTLSMIANIVFITAKVVGVAAI